jgi:hypothetical protein
MSRIGKSTVTESVLVVARGLGKEEMGSDCSARVGFSRVMKTL